MTTSQTEREVLIDTLLSEVQQGLQNAQQAITSSGFPPLKSVVLTLETEVVKQGGGKFKILIFTFGKTWQRETSQQLILTLHPPGPAMAMAKPKPSLADQLAQAIVAAAEGVKRATDREPKLMLQNFEATLSFVVSSTAAVGAEFEIVPVTTTLSGDLTKKARHSITVKFEAP